MQPAAVEVLHRTILFADLVGYSAMMGRDELGTLDFMIACSRLMDENSKRYGGEVVQTTGDGYLILFEDALNAVEFGVELHDLVAKRQTGVENAAQFRVGIHVGQVHLASGSIHGHAVNVAARLEGEALPGTCTVSQEVHDLVDGRSRHVFEAAGSPPLKNIAERLVLYRVPGTGTGSAAPTDAPVTVGVLSDVYLRSGPVTETFRADDVSAALLGYLALADGMREREDKVASLLWPELPAAGAKRKFVAARDRLRKRLSGALGELLFAVNEHIGLNELQFDTDLALVLKDLRRGRVAAILIEDPGWPDRILHGLDQFGPTFSAWRRVTISTWRSRILKALAELAQNQRAEADTCRDAAHAILALEPGNEAASAALIRHHAARDNRVAAIEEFGRIEAYLDAQHGLRPSEKLVAALAEARRTAAPAIVAETAGQPVAPRLLRIAVEAFEEPDGQYAHLATGFRSELVANLARFREWSVIEGGGVLAAAGRAEDGRARPLCHYSIAGTWIGIAEPMLRLQLREIEPGRIVWSEDVRVDPAGWPEVQRDVVGRIAAHLETYISADRLVHAIAGGGHNATSHDAWLQAERVFARWSPGSSDEAETILHAIIDRDPAFAPAYSSLASFRNVRHVIRPGLPRDAESERTADDLARRAVEIDPLDARNQLAVAWTAALTGAFDRAAIHLDLAASLNPNNPATLVSCAMGHAFIGQAERGETLVAHVLRISPMLSEYQWCYIASVHFLAGRYEEALKAAELSGDRIVDNQGWTAATLVRLGRMPEARAALDRLIDMVRPVWSGEGRPTAETIYGWFVDAYPLREPRDREMLAASLEAAMRGQ